jgi:DNA-binding CsgD family transcriptional regulator
LTVGSPSFAHPVDRQLARAVDELGRTSFAPQLLSYLNAMVRADHCVLYRFDADEPEILGAASMDGTRLAGLNSQRYKREFWRRDTVLTRLTGQICGYASEVACVPSDQIEDPEFRHELFHAQGLSGRAMLIGDRESGLYGLSLFRRSQLGFFSLAETEAIASQADMLVSCIAKHGTLLRRTQESASLLLSIGRIEARMHEMAPALTARERQVCARLIYGLEVKEAAKELGISPESAVTYRKRAFLRLGVSTRAELLRELLRCDH